MKIGFHLRVVRRHPSFSRRVAGECEGVHSKAFTNNTRTEPTDIKVPFKMMGLNTAAKGSLLRLVTTTTNKSLTGTWLRSFASTGSAERVWKIYLSGEIHSDWRDVIATGVKEHQLPVTLSSPNTSHEDSDDCGAIILGMPDQRPNWDKIGATMNGIRTRTLLEEADVVVVRFGDKYRQWNAAYDAGYAAAKGIPYIVLHPPSLSHMLKEVNANASVVCEDPEQVVQTLAYVIHGKLPATPRDGKDFIPIADRLGKGNPNP